MCNARRAIGQALRGAERATWCAVRERHTFVRMAVGETSMRCSIWKRVPCFAFQRSATLVEYDLNA